MAHAKGDLLDGNQVTVEASSVQLTCRHVQQTSVRRSGHGACWKQPLEDRYAVVIKHWTSSAAILRLWCSTNVLLVLRGLKYAKKTYFFALVSWWALANCSLSFLLADGSYFQCGVVKLQQLYFLFFRPFSLNPVTPRNSHVVVSEILRSAHLTPKTTPHANWPKWLLFSIQIEL